MILGGALCCAATGIAVMKQLPRPASTETIANCVALISQSPQPLKASADERRKLLRAAPMLIYPLTSEVELDGTTGGLSAHSLSMSLATGSPGKLSKMVR